MALRLDIGCGGRGPRWPGFIGIDIHPYPTVEFRGEEYVRLDFVHEPLPWCDGDADEIIGLHVIEHLARDYGRELVRRALRLLKPGCTLTLTCPDLRILCERYIAGDTAFWGLRAKRGTFREVWPGHTLADRLNWAIHQEGHEWSYDYESLCVLVREGAAAAETAVKLTHLEIGSKYSTRPDHECGVIVTKE